MARERCAFCGALNPASATWCGQCLRQFPPPEMETAEAAVSEETALEVSEPVAQAEVPTATAARQANGETTRGAFTITDEGITWKCHRCENLNPLEAQVCSVCGTSFAEVVRPPVDRPQRDPNMAALISLFLPGAGHMYLHLWPQGVARAIVSVFTMSVVLVRLLAGGRGGSPTFAITFAVAATALWVVGAHDAYREARGEPDLALLKGKIFVYTVLGLLMLLFIMAATAAMNVR